MDIGEIEKVWEIQPVEAPEPIPSAPAPEQPEVEPAVPAGVAPKAG